MAITKTTEIGKIEVVDKHRHIQVRTDTVLEEDGKEISRTYHRHVLHANMDISGEDAEVQAVANAVWTDDIKTSYQKFLDEEGREG